MQPVDLLWAGLVVAMASFVQSFAGFGFALVAVPLLSLRLPFPMVPPLLLLLGLTVNATFTARRRHYLRDPIPYIMLAAMVPSGFVGATVLRTAPEDTLKFILGCGVTAYAVRLAVSRATPARTRGALGMAVVAGGAAGLLGGMFGTSGPPLVMYVHAYGGGGAKTDFRGRILAMLLLENLWRTGVYVQQGLLTWAVAQRALLLLPVLGLGMWSGARTHHGVSDAAFRRVIAALLAGSGLALLLG